MSKSSSVCVYELKMFKALVLRLVFPMIESYIYKYANKQTHNSYFVSVEVHHLWQVTELIERGFIRKLGKGIIHTPPWLPSANWIGEIISKGFENTH